MRIGDKIGELELQVEPLRDQAEKAQRYLILRDELRLLEISVWMEKLEELRALVEELSIPVWFATLGSSNAVFVEGRLPEERQRLLGELDHALAKGSEGALRSYREDFTAAGW